MSRMHSNKSIVPGSAAPRSRAGSKKAKGRAFTITEILDPSVWIDRKCYTCETTIKCNVQPRPDPTSKYASFIVPKYNAPLICQKCRKDEVKFKTARKAMLEFFGWKEEYRGGWEG